MFELSFRFDKKNMVKLRRDPSSTSSKARARGQEPQLFAESAEQMDGTTAATVSSSVPAGRRGKKNSESVVSLKKRKARNVTSEDGDRSVVATAASAGSSLPPPHPTKKSRHLHTYERAKLKFDKIREEKELQRQMIEQERKDRKEALTRYKKNKRGSMKAMYKKTKRGQPKLGSQIHFILGKIEKTMKRPK